MPPLSIGIIGTGNIAKSHAENLKRIDGVRIATCYDILPAVATAFAAKHEVAQVAGNLKELLAQVDAICVCTPDKFHAAYALAGLKAGKHVLCEKPMTVTLAEAKSLAKAGSAAAKKGVIGMVNFSYRRSAAAEKAMQIVAAGKHLGALRYVHSHYLQGWMRNVEVPTGGSLWRLQRACGGGVLSDLGCHILDLTTAVAGEVVALRCAFNTCPKIGPKGKPYVKSGKAKMDADDSAVIELRFANGAMGVVHTTRWAMGRSNHIRVEVAGTEGALCFDLDRSYEQLDTCTHADRAWKTETLPVAPDIYQRWVGAIRSGKPAQPDFARGAFVQGLLDACRRSVASGTWEKVR